MLNNKWWSQIIAAVCVIHTVSSSSEEEEAQKYVEELEPKFNEICYKTVLAFWNSDVNASEETFKAASEAGNKFTELHASIQKEVNTRFPNWKTFQNKKLRRAMKFMAIEGPASMPPDRVQKMTMMQGQMQAAYGTATVCRYKDPQDCKLNLKDLEHILKNSTDLKEKEHYFTAWHDKMSELIKPEFYKEYIDFLNEWARANGYKANSDMWLAPYDDDSGRTTDDFEKAAIALEREITPMFNILHAYVRMKLRKLPDYAELIEKCGYIPVHVLGNMWAQEWTKIDSITKPFPDAPKLDATEDMKQQGYTPLKMFQQADKFLKDMGLMGMYPEFWENSILEKPHDRHPWNCQPLAWDTCKGKGNTDFRIKQCTHVTQRDFIVVHQEMSHLEYFQQYTDLQFVFRSSANPGFQKAIGEALALTVSTPSHFQCKLGLANGFDKSLCESQRSVTEMDLNFLYFTALSKLAVLPFALSIDVWRWDVFEGRSKPEEYNEKWWKLRKKYQGIIPPGNRQAKSNLFDPAAKFHIVANTDYVRFWIAGILTFQFYEALCIASGQYNPNDANSKPLYQCDYSGSKEAGKLLQNMMKLGFSQAWPDALEAITGSRQMKVEPMKLYLQPILDYMEKELQANGEIIGFGDSCEEVEKNSKVPLMSVNDYWEAFKSGKLFYS